MININLKNCPCCGAAAKIQNDFIREEWVSSWIECEKCSIWSVMKIRGDSKVSDDDFMIELIKDWNNRPESWLEFFSEKPPMHSRVIIQDVRGFVGECRYTFNEYAKTGKGRKPRFERAGQIHNYDVVWWQPLPESSEK